MDADEQIARFGISAGAARGQVIVTMSAELRTFTVEDWQRFLYEGAGALYHAKRQAEEVAA